MKHDADKLSPDEWSKKSELSTVPRKIALLSSLVVAISGATVLVGWILDISQLKSIFPSLPKMAATTALEFILGGLSLGCVVLSAKRKIFLLRVARIGAVIVTFIGLLKLGDYVFSWNLNFDTLGFHEDAGVPDFHPARMAQFTALNFVLLGSALLLSNGLRFIGLFQMLTLLAGLVGWLGFSRYLYGGEPLLPYGPMAIHTSICFLLLSVGIFNARTDGGLMALLLSNSAGGLLARRLLPPAMAIPFVVGWLRLKAQQAGWFGMEAGLSLFALSNVILFGTLVWIAASLLHRSDSKRRQTEGELKISAKELFDLKSVLDEHAIVAITDPQGKITYVNDKFCAISKYSREELLGQDHRIINSGFHPKEFIRDLWATIVRGKVWKGEIKNKAKDGSFYWVDTTIVPFLNDDGKPRQYIAIRADITDRKHAEEAKVQLAAIVESSDDAIIGKTLDGIITSWNRGAEKVFGYSSQEAIGKPMLMLFPPERFNEEPEILARIVRGESVDHFETVRIRNDGRRIDVSATISPLKDGNGKIIGASKIARNITERKRAEDEIHRLNAELEQRVAQRTAELEAANKELEAFSYSISHDLRAPLRAVNGFAGIVLEDFSPQLPEEGKRYLERIRNGGQQMGKLIDDLLAFSRLSRQPVSRQTIDNSKLVKIVLDELKFMLANREVEFQIGQLPPCRGDPALLKQVWINLISNAVKYSRDKTPAIIEISCKRENDEDVFFVRDNGTGFDMQYANKLFGVFQRLHRSNEFEGTGVGLAIVQRIVHRHGGRVWADAKLNNGATFYFTLKEGEKL